MNSKTFDGFEMAYVVAMLWSSTDENDYPLDDKYSWTDLSSDAINYVKNTCSDFRKKAKELLDDADDIFGYDVIDQAGHDLWLTQNRHGAGYWDRGIEEIGDMLTELAHQYGEKHPFVNSDGKIDL